MKIVLVAPSEIPARRANTIQVMKQAQAFTSLGEQITVLSPSPRQPGLLSWEVLQDHYGLVHRFPVQRLTARPRLRRYDFAWQAVQYARRWQADLLFTRLPQAAAISSLIGLPTIFEIHDLPHGRIVAWLLGRFLAGKGCRKIVVITRALAEALVNLHPSVKTSKASLLVAPDGIDLERYKYIPSPQQARAQLEIPIPERFTAGYTGHFYTGRGIELILQMAKLLPGINFLLVGGEHNDAQRLKIRILKLGLENIYLNEFVPNATLPRFQAACEVLLMPYQRHVAASSGGDIAHFLSPMKMFEYMACGRAILSSDLPVLREILTPDNAILLPPEDPSAWATTLREVFSDPDRRLALGRRALQDVQAYTWEGRARTILAPHLKEQPNDL